MIGSDDVLACFIAGNVFTWDDWFRLETMDDSLQPTIDMLLNVSIFMWFGAVCPWHQFVANSVIPIYRLILLGILVLLLRRLPMVLAFHKKIPQIEEIRHAFFVGFFGPIGVSAIFYLYVSREFLREIEVDGREREDAARLSELLNVVIWFLTVCSIFVHGLSIPLGKLGFYLPRTISTAISSERVSASQSMARTDDTELRGPGRSNPDDPSLLRTFRRRATTSERGDVPPSTASWLPRIVARAAQHIFRDLTGSAKRSGNGGDRLPTNRKEPNRDSSSGSNSPGGRPEISAPRDARLIGHAINDPPVRVSNDNANTASDDDGPRVHVTSPIQSPARSREGSPGLARNTVAPVSTVRDPPVGWQRTIRFGDEEVRASGSKARKEVDVGGD